MRCASKAAASFAASLALLGAAPAEAHESQPGRVVLTEFSPGKFEIRWRAPIYYGRPHPARLELPSDWKHLAGPTVRSLPDSRVESSVVDVPSLNGGVLRFPGLETTVTDVYVQISRIDGSRQMLIARPARPSVVLRGERPWWDSAREYSALGFHHILLGVDHLLFVLGLLIIVRGRTGMLLKTITAFTVAHSITLAMATLGSATPPGPPLNAAIALSILFLGPEIVRVWRGERSFTIDHPWVVAFAFGLLHGFGFATGLSTVGMPSAEIPSALLMFNVGVELGQLAFVGWILAMARAARALEFRWPSWMELLPGYAVGSLGAFWTIQRTVMLF